MNDHFPQRPLRQAVLLALTLLAGACTPVEALWTPADTPRDVTVERAESAAWLPATRNRLAPADTAQLRRLIEELGEPPRTRVTIALPTGAEQHQAVPVVRALAGFGVDPANITVARQLGGDAGPVRGIAVTAELYAAVPPRCPDWRRTVMDDNSFRPSSNFGCANANNLAVMLADPGDLAAPRRLGPADGAAQEAAVDRYKTNKVTPLKASSTVLTGASQQ
ncbi:pilus assembly protein CpaD [Azospirillum brasilense]|uniref:Pilus assembly protein CpaD n=1 Tax=Azospirillum brasilense TaxID=192 RepID=A0A560BTJ6_AZOBR|nr:CpaD family pilus assembly lipoprotein [Azospirillum brasilense]TWA75942.1 pilus assembly protein CpaD [Azospirillum brasilense]